jgi:fumarate reductase subunit D
VLLVVGLVLAPFSFVDARREGEVILWFVFVGNVLTVAVSAMSLWDMRRVNSSRGNGAST